MPTLLCVPEVKKAFDTMSSSASTAAGDLSDVETLSPAGDSTFGADESWPVHHAPQVVVRSTFLDVEELPSLSERFRRLRRAFTEPQVDSGTELYEPGKFSDDAAESDPESEVSQMMCVPVIRVKSVDQESTELVEPRDLPMATALPMKDVKNQEQGKTTVMLRNLPNNYTRSMLLNLLEKQGFVGRFDFLYLPCDFQRKANLGYAFVNMVNCQAVEDLWKTFDGFKGWALPSAKVCEVRWSGPHQGLEAHVERYRNSPVMHKSVPDEYRPVIFVDGQRQRFPAPTKFIKPPQAQSRR
mmetsp:Transcript_80589/g.127290  ORF Transcript_80589/g.127290 Transcript_80589/m.127290 type:complete len:298 (+) Transcript_80589:71-964(+)